MKTLRILIGRHYGFNSIHYTSMVLDNLLPILKTKFNVKIIWFFYMPEKIDEKIINDPNVEILDIHDFNNCVEVIKKSKPDLVIENEFPSLIDIALNTAAKYFKIPVIIKILAIDSAKLSKKRILTSFIPTFFHSKMPFELSEKKQFMRRGRFFLYKYKFLLKTLNALHLNFLTILKYFFLTFKWHLFYHAPYLDSRFAGDLHYLESEKFLDIMIRKGYSKESIVVTGSPVYDNIFKKYKNVETVQNKELKTRILFAPIQYYEGGLWTKKERDDTIKSIIKQLSKHKDEFSLVVKLHPSSQLYSDYEKIIHEEDPSIPIFQKGVLADFLDTTDLIISFSPIGGSLIFPLIAHKPVVLCNFFNFKYANPIEKDVAWECINPENLIETIRTAKTANNSRIIDNYLNKIMYKTDGCSSERLCNAIESLVKKFNP